MTKASRAIRLLAFDLDDTALIEGVIPRKLVERLAAFAGRGGIVSTASGRRQTVQEAILQASGIRPACGFPHYLICADKFIYQLDGSRYVELRDWNEAIAARWRRILPAVLERLPRLRAALLARGLDHMLRTQPGDIEAHEQTAYIALEFRDVAAAAAAMAVMARVFEGIEQACVNRASCFSGITLRDTGKGEALRRIARGIGLEAAQVLAVGDSYNDISMLDGRYGFRSAAVANAEPMVKDAVRGNVGYVARAAGADGLLEAMANWLGNEAG